METRDQKEARSFLGRGWSFPPTFSSISRGVVMTADEEDVVKSLEILLSTAIGERFLQPLYGCNLDEYVFAPFNATLSTEIRLTVKDAIEKFEPRLVLHGVRLDTGLISEGRVDIAIEYTIAGTNSRYNFIYPFYLNEANRN